MLTFDARRVYATIATDMERYERTFVSAVGADQPFLSDLITHVSRYKGKQLRPALVFLSARACGSPVTEDHLRVAVAIELIHTATLVHDDVIDEADKRRGLPSINSAYDNETSVLLGDWLFATAYGVAASLDTLDAARHLARTTRELCQGEVRQVSQRGALDLEEGEYLRIVSEKTAALYAASAELGARYAGADDSTTVQLGRFGRLLGTAFQIADDVLDLVGDEEEVGKSLGTDVEKGKLTLPVIQLLKVASPVDAVRARALLEEGSRDARDRLRSLLATYQTIQYAEEAARNFTDEAKGCLASLPDTQARDSLIALADYVITRTS